MIARLKAAWGPGTYETLQALGLERLAENVEGRLYRECRERNARAARKSESEGGEENGPTVPCRNPD